MKGYFALLAILILSGCASQEEASDPYAPVNTHMRASGAAYVTDTFEIKKPMPKRPKREPAQFYFKSCTQMSESTHYSKTSYDCNTP